MKNKIKLLVNNQFFQGSFIFTASNFIISVFNYFFNFLAGRALGPMGYGEIAAYFSYTAIFSLPFTIISMLVIQKIGSKDINPRGFARSLEIWFDKKIKSYWSLAIVLIVFVPFIPKLTNVTLATAIAITISVILSPFFVFYSSALQGLKMFLAFALISVVVALIKLSGAILVTLKIDGVLTILICLTISNIIYLAAAILTFKKSVKVNTVKSNIEKRLIHALLNKYFFLTSISILSITLLSNLDMIFVKKFLVSSQAGFLGAWILFSRIIFYLVGPLISLSFIFFSSKKNADGQNKILSGSFIVLAFVSLICYCFYSFFPSLLVNIVFGNKFQYISRFLILGLFFGIFYSIINLMNNYFLAKKNLLALILPVSLPVYIIILFIFRNNLVNIMKVDVIFSATVSVIYLFAYFLQKKFNRSFIISS